ncbi:MAG: hypothetical protein CMQ11_15905 [Gammaproteobacteria bacterium]|nr:hypothetical protein [Gammaproteobacteria bacterium]
MIASAETRLKETTVWQTAADRLDFIFSFLSGDDRLCTNSSMATGASIRSQMQIPDFASWAADTLTG